MIFLDRLDQGWILTPVPRRDYGLVVNKYFTELDGPQKRRHRCRLVRPGHLGKFLCVGPRPRLPD